MSLAPFAWMRQLRDSRLARFAIAYASAAAFQKGVGFVLFLWVAHTLSVSDYAIFGLLYALQSAVTSFASAGIVESAIGLLKRYPAPAQQVRLFSAANSAFLVLAFGSSVFGLFVGAAFMRGAAGTVVNLSAVVIAGLAAAYVAIQASLVRLNEHHGASLSLGFFVPLSALVGGAIGLSIGRTVTTFYLGSALASLLALVPFLLRGVGNHRFLRDRAEVVGLLGVLAPFILIAVLAWLGGYGNTYLVDAFFDPINVASFSLVYSVSAVMQLVATALNQVWSPRFYRMVHDMPIAEVEQRNRRFTTVQGATLGAVGAVVLLAFTPAMDIAGGNLVKYRGLRFELFFLFLAYAVSIPWWHAQNYYYAHNKGRELLRVSLLSSLVGVLLWMAAALALGPLGAYVGFFFQMAARSWFALARARREWTIRIAWEGPVLAAGGMLAGLLGAHWLLG
jgi:O-antigen/teichoic acid export membrane protein